MMIRDMFADDINRKINGVIKVDQAADDVIEQELKTCRGSGNCSSVYGSNSHCRKRRFQGIPSD